MMMMMIIIYFFTCSSPSCRICQSSPFSPLPPLPLSSSLFPSWWGCWQYWWFWSLLLIQIMLIREVVSKNYSPRGNSIKVWNSRGWKLSVFWIFRGWIILITTDRLMCMICFIKWFQKSERSLVKTNARSRHSSITLGDLYDHVIISFGCHANYPCHNEALVPDIKVFIHFENSDNNDDDIDDNEDCYNCFVIIYVPMLVTLPKWGYLYPWWHYLYICGSFVKIIFKNKQSNVIHTIQADKHIDFIGLLFLSLAVDACAIQPCLNGGFCFSSVDCQSYICQCSGCFSGSQCQICKLTMSFYFPS